MRTLLILTIGAFVLTGCNTVEGVGRDVKGAGQAIEKGAKKTKKAITE